MTDPISEALSLRFRKMNGDPLTLLSAMTPRDKESGTVHSSRMVLREMR